MKKALTFLLTLIIVLSLTGCFLKKSDSPCSRCQSEDAFLYKIDHVGREVLEEKITVSYCESCYQAYLEETFGKGARAKAEIADAHFKDVVGSGGYLNELTK